MMTQQNDKVSSIDPRLRPFIDHWATCVRQAKDATQEILGSFEGHLDPQAWRRQWFEALSRNTDSYLRSPPFLQMMKAHIDALIEAKRPLDELTEAGNSHTTASDTLNESITASVQRQDEKVMGVLSEELGIRASELDGMNAWDRFLNTREIPRAQSEQTQGTTPYDVVYEAGSLRLLRYRNDSVRFAEPILICFALVNRPYILDLQGERSVVRRLVDRGFDVYLIDWGTPTDADQALRLYDYVCRFLTNVVDLVCERSGSSQVSLLGYCMGGTLATMFTALHPDRVRNLILMATPIDFGGEEGMLNLWAREEYFDVDGLIDVYGNCPGQFLQYCFQLMRPVQNFAEKYLTLCDNLHDDAFLENFFAMERWANDSIPVAGETFREYVKTLYQQNRLVRGEVLLGGVPVKLSAITCPLLLLVADQDHLVPPSSTLSLVEHVGSYRVKSLSIDAGHIGLAVSSKAHRRLWPQAADWIASHSTVKE